MDLNEAIKFVLQHIEETTDFTRYDPYGYNNKLRTAMDTLKDMLPPSMQ